MSGFLETLDSHQVFFVPLLQGEAHNSNETLQPVLAAGFHCFFLYFFYFLLIKSPVEILGQKTKKGYKWNIELSCFWIEQCLTKR